MNNQIKNVILMPFNMLYKINPVLCTKIMFELKLGKKLDLVNPQTFNEKLQWIKLYDKDPLKPKCVDKYTVREYVKSVGCSELLNELLWQGYNPEDIPFEKFPKQYVIKATHGQGMNIICKDSSKLNRNATIKLLRKWLKEQYLPCYGEWFYGKVRPRIIVEKFLSETNNEEPADYKVFCFNGEPKVIDVHTGRFTNHKRNFYDLNWNVIKNVSIKYPCDESEIVPKPKELELMLTYAKKLSSPFIHVRCDFYIVNGKIYFGELTFTNGAGFDKIKPHEFDLLLGSYIDLPNDKVNSKDK